MNHELHLQKLIKEDHETSPCLNLLYMYGLQAETIVELGVDTGISTQALLIACHNHKAYLWSVDVSDCSAAHKTIAELELTQYWTFTKMNSLKFVGLWNPQKKIDLLFVDSCHVFEHVLNELKSYSPLISKDGVILLHDTQHPNLPGVKKAIQAFLKQNPEWNYRELLPNDCWGLGELKK